MRISDWSSDVCSSDLYPTGLAARHAIVDQLRRPLGSLPEADRAFIDALLGETPDKTIIADRIRERFQSRRGTSCRPPAFHPATGSPALRSAERCVGNADFSTWSITGSPVT